MNSLNIQSSYKVKKVFSLVLCILLVFLSLFSTSCNQKSEDNPKESEQTTKPVDVKKSYPVQVGDITFKEAPKNIVVLTPSLTEIFFDMGYGIHVVGKGDLCDYPESLSEVASVGSATSPNAKIIQGLSCDVVFTQSYMDDDAVNALKDIGVPVINIPPAKTVDELEQIFLVISQIFEGESEGKSQSDTYFSVIKGELNKIKSELEKASAGFSGNLSDNENEPNETQQSEPSQGETVSTGAEGNNSPVKLKALYFPDDLGHVVTGGTFINDLLNYLNIQNLAVGYSDWKISDSQDEEAFAKAVSGAEVIFCPKGMEEVFKAKEELAESPAVKNGMVFAAEQILLERQSKRFLEALKLMSEDLLVNYYKYKAAETPAASETTAPAPSEPIGGDENA